MNKNITAEGAAMDTTTHNHKEHTTANAPLFHSAFFQSLHKERWQEVRLGEMIKTNCKSIDKNYPYNIVQYLDTGSITDNRIESLQKFDLEDLPSRAKRLVQDNDIIYSLVRPIQRHFGFIKNPRKNLIVSTGFCTITTYQNILDSKFLYYFLTFDETIEFLDLIAEASTSAYPAIKPSDIENLTIPLPPLETQQRIAEILSSFDDKIDLLHRQNKTLESLALTLFRHTFIENPNRNEWEEKPLSEVCEIKNGFAFKSEEYKNSGIPIIRTTNFENGFIETNNLVYIQNNENQYSKYALRKNDFLLVMVGASIGKYATVTNEILPAFQNQNMWNFRALPNISQYYLNQAMRDIIVNNINSASGSAREFFQKSYFYKIPILIPKKDIMYKFHKEADSFYCKIENNRKQIQSLQQIRDLILKEIFYLTTNNKKV